MDAGHGGKSGASAATANWRRCTRSCSTSWAWRGTRRRPEPTLYSRHDESTLRISLAAAPAGRHVARRLRATRARWCIRRGRRTSSRFPATSALPTPASVAPAPRRATRPLRRRRPARPRLRSSPFRRRPPEAVERWARMRAPAAALHQDAWRGQRLRCARPARRTRRARSRMTCAAHWPIATWAWLRPDPDHRGAAQRGRGRELSHPQRRRLARPAMRQRRALHRRVAGA